MRIKSQIITSITDGDYLSIARNITKESNAYKDLFQELIIVLIEYDEAKLIKVNKDGYLKYFCVRIMRNMWTNERHPFYKKHRMHGKSSQELGEVAESEEYKKDFDEFISKIEAEFNGDYDKELLRLSVELGSSAEVSRQTGINKMSISDAVNRAKNELKKKYGKV